MTWAIRIHTRRPHQAPSSRTHPLRFPTRADALRFAESLRDPGNPFVWYSVNEA